MRKLLLTTALVVPLAAGPVLAQDAQQLPEDDQTEAQAETGATGTAPGADDAPAAADDPAATDDPATADDPGAADDPATADDPAATDDPATADDPAATDDPATADDPAATDDPAMADDPAATDDPATADDPAATDDPAMADDPTATDDPALADDPTATDDAAVAGDEAPAEAPESVVTEQQPGELRSDWIIGTSVMSPQDETIGSIQDLIIDEEEGRVTAAVLSVGGFLGFGAKNIAVDWNELQINHDAREITLDITREEADAAPEYAFRDQAEAPAPAGGMGAPDAGAAPPPGADPGAPGGDPGAPVD